MPVISGDEGPDELTAEADTIEVRGEGGDDILTGTSGDDRLLGGDGDDVLEGGLGDDWLDGGPGRDTVSYENAPGPINFNHYRPYRPDDIRATDGAGTDTVRSIENIRGSAFDDTIQGSTGDNVIEGLGGADTLRGFDGDDTIEGGEGDDVIDGGVDNDLLIGGAGADYIDGGDGDDTAQFVGNFADYIFAADGAFTIEDAGGAADTLESVEFLQFDDQLVDIRDIRFDIDLESDPDVFMPLIRDYDGNDLGAGGDWSLLGVVDIQGDGDLEYVFTNMANGRWATVGPDEHGGVSFADHGEGGDTRVVGIYIDPLVASGEVVRFSDHDSQQRFQNDLNIGNIAGILGADDYDGDGLQEVYFALADQTAYLHAYMHADGNIQYANYQNEQQVIDFMQANDVSPAVYEDWFYGA